MQLTEEHKHYFFHRGWLKIENLYTPDEIEKAKKSFDQLEKTASELKTTQIHHDTQFVLDQRDDETIIHRIVWAGGCEPYLLDIGQDPRIINLASQLLESNEVIHLLNQAHFKKPNDGVEFQWHQDIQNRDKGNDTWKDIQGNGSYVQSILILDEMTLENGPLLFVPESGLQGKLEKPLEVNRDKAITITAKPGTVLFFGPYTVHCSFVNESEYSRRVLINGYAYPGCNGRVYPGSGLGIPLKKDI